MADRPKKFIKGHNPLKAKAGQKPLSKAKELEKKKAEEAETEAVLNEYIADFQTGAVQGKAFIRAGIEAKKSDGEVQRIDNAADSPRLYKPKSKMQELAEEFRKSKEISSDYKTGKDAKKKAAEKKKSNLELFKEELEQSQKERDIRRKLRSGDLSGISEDVLNSLPPAFFKPKSTEDEFGYQYEVSGSHDTGDPTTTNLFISNINPRLNEEQLCKVFGRYGPLASVKIMWPRTDEEKLRNRNCGFVAFMTRKDGEKALADIEGKYVMDFEMKIGWGKAVPIPPQPVYVHPSQSYSVKPPKQSGLPFNCQLPYKQRKQNLPFDGNFENTIVKVVIPTERNVVSLINRVVEFVVREGPMFEAMIMNRELGNPMYRFLFDNQSNEHVYYRWRVYSLLQGDTTQKWNQKCFRMFLGGSIWQPPSFNPFGGANQMTSGMTASAALACASSANVHSTGVTKAGENEESTTLAMKKNLLLQHLLQEDQEKDDSKSVEKEKKTLSDRQRDRLEDMLRTVTTDRVKVGELMMWCIDHAEYSEEIVECICESLSILETPFPIKIARLFVVSDILYNSSVKVHNASSYRKVMQEQLLDVMEYMHKALQSCSTKMQAEKFRKQVLSCLAAWQDWSLYPPAFLINLQNVFVGISTSKDVKTEEEQQIEEAFLSKEKTDDIDGEPIITDDDIDGIPFGKPDDLRSKSDTKGQNKGSQATRLDDPLAQSRWERSSDGDEIKKSETVTSKWQKVEEIKEVDDNTKHFPENNSPDRNESNKSFSSDTLPVAQNEEERKKLRDVELKVMRFIDKLEQRGGNKTGLNIQKEAAKFRQQLLEDFEASRNKHKKLKKDSRRDGSGSSDEKHRHENRKRKSSSPYYGESLPPRSKKHHRDRSRSSSRSLSPSSSNRGRSPGRREMSNSPQRRSPRRGDSLSPALSPYRSNRSPSPRSPRRQKKKSKKNKR